MKNSRTSTNKKVVKKPIQTKKRVSTSPSSANTKKALNNKNKIKKSNDTRQSNKPAQSTKRNIRNPQNNIRLNNSRDEDTEYVPFLDNTQEIIPNRIRKVEPISNTTNDKKSSKKIKSTTIIKITFFIAIIIGMVYLLFTLETFNLTGIKVNGNEKYTSDDVISKCNLKIGQNVFKQLIFNDNKKIDLSYISESSFSYVFPSTIVISINERYPAYIALDKNTNKYYKIDNEGYILEQCGLDQKKDEVLVEGLVFEENVKLGEKINEVYIKKIDIYNSIKELLEKHEIQGNITKVNFSNSLTIISLDDKLKIVFANDSNLEYKVLFLKGIIQKNGGIVEGSIDMSIENPVYSKYN